MKIFRRVLLAVVLLVIVALVAVYFNLNRIVRRTVETQATASLNLNTTLGAADLAIFGGEVKLKDLKIASPAGFSAPEMFTLGGTDVKVSYGQLRNQPIRINTITISKPTLVIEQADGKWNFKTAMDQIPKSPEEQKPAPGSNSEPMKLIIDELNVETATVTMRPGDLSKIPGISALGSSIPKEITVQVPTLNLKNIGNADGSQNGAAIKDVVMQVVTALADSAAKSGGLPDQLKGLLNLNLDSVKGQLGAEFQKQLGGLTKGLPGNVGDLVKDPSALTKDPGKALQNGLGSVLGNKSPTTGPSTQPDPKSALEDGVQGLFGGKKKK